MKKMLTMVFVVLALSKGFPQNDLKEPNKRADRFFIGLTYEYIQADMKLLTMTKHSFWDNQDLGTVELSKDDIDTINTFMDYREKVNNISLNAGMVLLNKPDNPWYIDGRILFGYISRENILNNKSNDSEPVEFTSKQNSPSFGLALAVKYFFNDKWAMAVILSSLYTSGNSNEIDENIYPEVTFMDESRDNKYMTSYTLGGLMASYSLKKITIAAGPGFYYLYNRNEYHIVRTDPENGATYEDNIETTLRAKSFINVNLRFGWQISNHFQFNAAAGISNDITINAGLLYFF